MIGASVVCGPEVLFREVSFRTISRHCGCMHKATDIFAPEGAHVHAPETSTVVSRNLRLEGAGGFTLRLRGTSGFGHFFSHLAQPAHVDVGQKLTVGQLVAFVGKTGNAVTTGPHDHYKYTDPRGVALNAFEQLRSVARPARAVGDRTVSGRIDCPSGQAALFAPPPPPAPPELTLRDVEALARAIADRLRRDPSDRTVSGLRDFQLALGLHVDGVAGGEVCGALEYYLGERFPSPDGRCTPFVPPPRLARRDGPAGTVQTPAQLAGLMGLAIAWKLGLV